MPTDDLHKDEERILKFFQGELPVQERRAFEKQLETSQADLRLFREMNFVYQATDAIRMGDTSRTEAAYKKVQRNIRRNVLFHRLRRSSVRVAAMLAFPLLLVSIYLYVSLQAESEITYNEVACVDGKVTSVILPDGTTVYLHSKSSLRYPNKFTDDQRVVELKGEGYFEVESDKSSPFYVQVAGGSRVKAYGTAFNVRAYEADDDISVFLVKGAVDFIDDRLLKPVVLEPGMELVYHKSSASFEKALGTADEHAGWTQGRIVFNNAPLEDVTRILSRHYNVDIQIKDQQLRKYFFTATFTDETIYQILNLLQKSSPGMQWEIDTANSSDEKQSFVLTIKSE